MNNRPGWERLIGLMEQESALLDEFALASGRLKDSLHAKKWQELEKALSFLEDISASLESVEKKRHSLAEKLRGGKNLDTCITELPEEERARISTLRSELKARLLTVKSRTQGLAGYANSRARLGREILEELVPSTRGRIYDNRGLAASAGPDPLVVSRHL